jgi:hypothetical protein
MWVFDGEQWIDEGGSEQTVNKAEQKQFDMFLPELQVVELVIPNPWTQNVPPFPMP